MVLQLELSSKRSLFFPEMNPFAVWLFLVLCVPFLLMMVVKSGYLQSHRVPHGLREANMGDMSSEDEDDPDAMDYAIMGLLSV